MQKQLNVIIPSEIAKEIQKFYNIDAYTFIISKIPGRSNHNGCLIKSNNKLGFFIFGGNKKGNYNTCNDTYIIWL